MNHDELKEVLRLTAIALGDGWSVTSSFGDPRLNHPSRRNYLYPDSSDADSRWWLERDLLIDITHSLIRTYGEDYHGMISVSTDLADHNNDRHAATRWPCSSALLL